MEEILPPFLLFSSHEGCRFFFNSAFPSLRSDNDPPIYLVGVLYFHLLFVVYLVWCFVLLDESYLDSGFCLGRPVAFGCFQDFTGIPVLSTRFETLELGIDLLSYVAFVGTI